MNFHEDGRIKEWNRKPEEHSTESLRGRWQPDGQAQISGECFGDAGDLQFTCNEYKSKTCIPLFCAWGCGEATLELELTAAEIELYMGCGGVSSAPFCVCCIFYGIVYGFGGG